MIVALELFTELCYVSFQFELSSKLKYLIIFVISQILFISY